LSEHKKGLVYFLFLVIFNPQIKTRLNGIKLFLLTFGMNWIYDEQTHSTINLTRQNTFCLIFHLLEDNNVKIVFNRNIQPWCNVNVANIVFESIVFVIYLWSKVVCFVFIMCWDLLNNGASCHTLGIFRKLSMSVHQLGLGLFGVMVWTLLIIEPFS
jgi:hypothetical protein